MPVTAAIIAGGSTVAAQMLANRNKQIPTPSAPSIGGASQMNPMGTALAGPGVQNPNPAFGSFLGGKIG